MAEIDRLLDDHDDSEIASILSERGYRSGEGNRLHRKIVSFIRRAYGLKTRYDRLRERGYLTVAEIAERLGVCVATANYWSRRGLLKAVNLNDKGQRLFDPAVALTVRKEQGRKIEDRIRDLEVLSDRTNQE